MSCSDIECPYCGKGQDVCHDDGFGNAEDVAHVFAPPSSES